MNSKGFLLLEVMVSIAILSIAIVVILNSFITSVRAMNISEDYFTAVLLAEEKLFEVHNSKMEEDFLKGEFPDFGRRFSWGIKIQEIEESSLRQVDLELSWKKANTKKGLKIATFFKK